MTEDAAPPPHTSEPDVRHRLIQANDALVGARAERARAELTIAELQDALAAEQRAHAADVERLVAEFTGSTRWRVGDALLSPIDRVRRRRR
ncbi:hypothetical protein ITJ66_17955 [Plantibacter sp. VKM Ac-2885]|uniref:hypothetical protein n=1 Tax=Plantibacter sp. VKM Ac-2885 TaxID=2783828 RepID=UPI00188A7E5C|nr:hypothetical protein [Plantibacter sp. VKM Ac-2885]MBF4514375.1 hypothetical protein [Plantibacter sp. VKM Ac-2885]